MLEESIHIKFSSPCGVVLAGGQSRRMGRPKEGVLLADGRPMICHVIQTLRAVVETIVVIGGCTGYDLTGEADLIHLEDIQPGLGPLSGLHGVLSRRLANQYLVVTCDQPQLTSELLNRLLQESDPDQVTLFSLGDGHPVQPFPGCYSDSLLPQIESALENQEYALRQLISKTDKLKLVPLDFAEASKIQSMNTPEQLSTLLKEACIIC